MKNTENLKVMLLSVIAFTLIVNTYLQFDGSSNPVVAVNSTQPTQIPPPNLPEVTADLTPSGPLTSISFAEENFDFGTINQESENVHLFKFTNTGNEPLIISNAKGSCGCTVPKYPTEPILPGNTGEIEVIYKPGKQKGNQAKYVTVTANTNPAQTKVQITANVLETE